MPSLLDQTVLADVAERIVALAKRAGADQADAFAVRGVSLSVEVRDGAVEEAERSEHDDIGLRVLVGGRQAIVSTNDTKGDPATLAARAVALVRQALADLAASRAREGEKLAVVAFTDLTEIAWATSPDDDLLPG